MACSADRPIFFFFNQYYNAIVFPSCMHAASAPRKGRVFEGNKQISFEFM